jgi:hypothetical protein
MNKYDEYFKNLVKWAKDNHKSRPPSPPKPKEIPSHIVPQQDEDKMWGMFNTRLNEWVGRGEERTRYRSQEKAEAWYRSLI